MVIKSLILTDSNNAEYKFYPDKKYVFYSDTSKKVCTDIDKFTIKDKKIFIEINDFIQENALEFVFAEDRDEDILITFKVLIAKDFELLLSLEKIEKHKWNRSEERKKENKPATICFHKIFSEEENEVIVELGDISNSGCGFFIPSLFFSKIDSIKSIKIDNEEKDIIIKNTVFDKDRLLIGAEFKKNQKDIL